MSYCLYRWWVFLFIQNSCALSHIKQHLCYGMVIVLQGRALEDINNVPPPSHSWFVYLYHGGWAQWLLDHFKLAE